MKRLGNSSSQQFSIPSNPSQFTFSDDQIKKAPGAGFYNSNMSTSGDNSFSAYRKGGKGDGQGDGQGDGKGDGKGEGGEDGFFSKQDVLDIQKAGFDQQNKIFQQSLAMGGIDKIAQGLYAGPQTYATKIVPQIFAGNAAILSAGAADNRSLAGVMSQPYRQLQMMRFFS